MISVCLATFNGEKFVRRQIESIIHQLSLEDELIISDDGSTDNTLEILESFADSRLKIFKNSFGSPVTNFEFLIGKAKGDFIFLADQDDVWDAFKVVNFKKYFDIYSDLPLFISDVQIIDKDGFPLNELFYPAGFKGGLIQNILKNNFIGCSMAFKREVTSVILPFPKNVAMHDWWIGACCIMLGDVYFIDKKLIYYRMHDHNFTKLSKSNLLLKLKWRLFLAINLVLRYVKHAKK